VRRQAYFANNVRGGQGSFLSLEQNSERLAFVNLILS